VLGRIAFIGTPHHGSTAIAGYLKNHLWGLEKLAILGLYLSRETFRSFWGVLSLMPAPAGVYPGTAPNDNPKWAPAKSNGNFYVHPCANFDLYDVNPWGLNLTPDQFTNLQIIMNAVAGFHKDLYAWHNDPAELLQEYCDRMLMVAGVGYKGLFRLEYTDKLGGLWSSMDKITDRVPGNPHRDGDGRVPLASAQLKRITTRYVKGVHGGLTNIPAVYDDVFRWLKGERLSSLATTPADAMGGHLSAGTDISDAPNLDGSAMAHDDDPGYLNMAGFHQLDEAEADRRLERGVMPDFPLARIL
jgi:hypothetical protein